MAVAFIGLGRMGSRMAASTAAAGHDLVLHNRTAATADALGARLGCAVAGTPRGAAAAADVVITVLADAEALRAVLGGPDGIVAGLRPGTVVVDMGTTGPRGIAALAPAVTAAGGVLVDAPVSGSTAAAEAGALTILLGAPDDAHRRIRPLLEAMGDPVLHMGGTGAGSVAKLAVNNVVYALGNAIAESLVLAERAGLDRAQVYAVFEQSAVAAPMVAYRRDAFLDPETTPPSFTIALALKDLGLITDLAASVGLPAALAEASRALLRRAVDAGLGARDMADAAVYLRGR